MTALSWRTPAYFCGRCRAEIMEKHLGSPHGNFGDPSCLYCHGRGSHNIPLATVDIIDPRPRGEQGRCALCHQAGTMATVADIKETLQKAADLIDSSAAEFFALEELGYRNLGLAETHHHTAETRARLRRVFHSLNMRDINELTRSIESAAKQTDAALELVRSLRRPRRNQSLVGLGAVVSLPVFAGLLVYYKHAFCEDYDRSTAVPGAGRPGTANSSDE